MIVNKTTMLITDFGEVDSDKLYTHIKELVINGNISEYVQPIFDDWAEQCGLNTDQRLVMMSTVFPQRVLLSIIEEDYNLQYQYYKDNHEWPSAPWRNKCQKKS